MKQRKLLSLKNSIFFACFLCIALVFLFLSTQRMSNSVAGESLQISEKAVRRALVTCYALEGSYPSTFEYLEENYGLSIDHSKYIVDYDCFASNIMPDFVIIRKGR